MVRICIKRYMFQKRGGLRERERERERERRGGGGWVMDGSRDGWREGGRRERIL